MYKTEVKISVLMPCYNAAAFISEAIRSVLDQSMRDFEFLIVNDGSTDNTVEIINSFKDDRIRLIEQQQLGIAAALNTGLKFASAAYIARFDADDICYPDRLEKQYDFMKANPDYTVVGSAADYMDEGGNYIFTHYPPAEKNDDIQRLSFKICPFIHASVMYRKESVERIGYNLNAHSFEDHLLWLQLKGKGKMYNMSDRLLSVRINPKSLTIDERKRSRYFRTIKARTLKQQRISIQDGNRLSESIHMQNNPAAKEGAYYSLLAKKFLWNNYDPLKARSNMKKAIRLNPFDIKDYLLFVLSYFPKKIVNHIYLLIAAVK
jgi:glycosyltransferase involved in cell wall biosynthesis